MSALRRVIAAFGIAPYRPDQPLSTRVGFPFRVLAVVAFLLLGPGLLWMACDNVGTGTAVFAYSGASTRVTRQEFPRLFWTFTVVTAGLGLSSSLLSLSILYGAITQNDERQ